MKKFIKISLTSFLVLAFSANFTFAAVDELGTKRGEHKGEEPPLEYWIEYLNPLGVTTVDEDGIIFSPFEGGSTLISEKFPERYFDDYPLYFSGGNVEFRVHIKNTGRRAYYGLLILTQQEFFNKDGGEGEAFPGSNLHQWGVEELGAGEEIVLEGTIEIPSIGSSGLDQTHLQILHWPAGNAQSTINGGGQILVDDSQAGIWCPV